MSDHLRHPIRVAITAFVIGAWPPISSCAQDQFDKLKEALGPDSRLSINEAEQLRTDACDLSLRGDFTQASRSLQKALSLTEAELGTNHHDVPLLLIDLAEVTGILGQYDKAEALLTRSLEISERVFGSEHPLVAGTSEAQAALKEQLGRYDQALSLCKRSLAIYEEAYDNGHVAVGLCLLKLGSIFKRQAKYREALAALEQSRSIVERKVGSEHFTVALILNELSWVHQAERNYPEALALAQRSLGIREKIFGPSHLAIAESLYRMASIQLDLRNSIEAERLLLRALTITETALGENHASVADCLERFFELYWAQDDYTRALQLFDRCVAIKKRVFGDESPQMADSYEIFGEIQQALGDNEQALKAFGLCLKIRLSTVGNKHPSVADAMMHLGSVYLDTRDYTNALACYEGSLIIRKEILGNDHPDVAVNLGRLANFWFRFGKVVPSADARIVCNAKSASYTEEAIEAYENVFGSEHPDVTTAKEDLALVYSAQSRWRQAILTDWEAMKSRRSFLVRQVAAADATAAMQIVEQGFVSAEKFQSLCAVGVRRNVETGKILGAEQLVLGKALLEEVQAAQMAMQAGSPTTQDFQGEYRAVMAELTDLPKGNLSAEERYDRRRRLNAELSQLEAKITERSGLLGQIFEERNVTVSDVAKKLPLDSALVDFIECRSFDPTDTTNAWTEQRYAAYLTFPLARDSTNVVVERVDLGEAVPINTAVELVCKRMSAGQFGAKDLAAALKRLSQRVYAPLAPYLTNVSHLIVCPDGQLSRLPFEMLSASNKFLVEEKTISYVTSGREVVRIAKPLTRPAATLPPSDGERAGRGAVGKSLVMGNPDFDLDLSGSRRESALTEAPQRSTNNPPPESQSQLTLAATRALSRDYRGLRFNPLPGSGIEATNVAQLLGDECSLRLGAEARESELKAVVSPRVLHLATHGFFLSDQEFKHTDLPRNSWPTGLGTRWNAFPPQDQWENPMVRCGIALAGANHARQITNAVAEDGILTGLEASLLNLQGTELGILSACDSGTGEVKIGEGVMSLRRAFRVAGAETVLASHWNVSDEATGRLMTEFMRRWRSGKLRAKAWREAQLALLRSRDFSNPFFWAAFTLTGHWN